MAVYYRSKAMPRGKVVINDQAPDFETLQKILRKYDEDISLEQAKRIGEFLLRVNGIVVKAKLREQENSKSTREGNNE
jgi:hypothetical protein